MVYKRNFYMDFSEEQKQFCFREAGFTKREKELFHLRVNENKMLWECANAMGFCDRTIERIHSKMQFKIINIMDRYYSGISKGWH